jgi:cytochrome b6
MKFDTRRKYTLGLTAIILGIILLFLGVTRGHATAPPPSELPDWEQVAASADLTSAHPDLPMMRVEGAVTQPPNQDPCLHCHIKGEEKGLWTPLARWVVFGTAGLFFIFGIVRNATVWKNRAPWKTLTSRVVDWVEERYEIADPLSKFLSKPVPDWQRHWWYCLGGITAFLFFVQGFTGILLAFYYKPTPDAAYTSIQFIEEQVRFGSAIRMIHHWSANGMVVMCIAHMMRVFISGAFKSPRELNWVSGMILLIMTLGFGLTGYLLPWDQRAFWATTVASEIAGALPVIGDLALVFMRVGWDVSSLTLSRFYALHIIGLPLVTVGTMGLHFLMVRRQGIHKPL